MSRRRVDVDFGPMHLPVGEDANGPERGGAGMASAGPQAIRRFRESLDQRRRPRAALPDEEEDMAVSPFELLADLSRQRDAAADELGAAITRAWVSDVRSGAREVRVTIASRLLEDAVVRMHEDGGVLQIELRIGCNEGRRWLQARLAMLVRRLADRLGRPLAVTLFASEDDEAPLARAHWPEGTSR